MIYPEAKVREVSDAAFKMMEDLRLSDHPRVVQFRETFSQLVVVDAINRVSGKVAESNIDIALFGLYDGLLGIVEPA